MKRKLSEEDRKQIEEYLLIPELSSGDVRSKYGYLSKIDIDLRLDRKSDQDIKEMYSERDIFIHTSYVDVNEILKKYIEYFINILQENPVVYTRG